MGQAVLIVEDDASLRMGMQMLFRRSGLTAVMTASTLAEARACIQTTVPSHAIIDLNLPDGLGSDLLSDIRSQGLPTRVMVLTGSASVSLAARAKELGAEHVLHKPPDWDDLIKWVHSS